MKDEKEILKDLIKAIVDGEKKEKCNEMQEIIDIFKENKEYQDPEKFDLYITFKIKQYLLSLLEEGLPQEFVSSQIINLYLNYSFLERNIKQLCILREGWACCADKSRYILEIYLEYLKTNEIPTFKPNEKKYYKPNFGNNEDWIKFCKSLIELNYGNPANYIKQYNKLLQSKIRKYKHIKHSWHLKFKDGEDIIFDTSWDDNIKTPPICADKLFNNDEYKGYYALNKRYVKTRNYKGIGEGMFTTCFIPKTDVEKIYKISEEVMQ